MKKKDKNSPEEQALKEQQKAFKKKRKENRKNIKTKKSYKLVTIFLPLFLALVVFFGLLSYMEVRLKGYDNVKKVVAIKDVPEGTFLSRDNVGTYFEIKEIKQDAQVKGSVDRLEDLFGLLTSHEILQGSVMSLNYTTSPDDYRNSFFEPVEVSFNVIEMYRVLNGTLRKGDFVDITMVLDENFDGEEEIVKVASKVYILEAYDTSYTKVSSDDTKSLACNFTILLEKEDVDDFIRYMSLGKPYLSLSPMDS